MPLVKTCRPGDVIRCGDIVIRVHEKTGQSSKLTIDAPDDVAVLHEKTGQPGEDKRQRPKPR